MKEELVTFKVALLAKDKGFENTEWSKLGRNYYNHKGEVNGNCIELVKAVCRKEDTEEFRTIDAPTQSLLQRWLREEHNIFINIGIDQTTYPKYCYQISRFIGNPKDLSAEEWDWEDIPPSSDWGLYRTYEQALEKGLLKALKLIK